MLGHRIGYLAALWLSGIFYLLHGEWFSYVLLMGLLGLPWLSLVLSLGAIWSFTIGAEHPHHVEIGEAAEAWLVGANRWPMPPFRGKLRLRLCMTGERCGYSEKRGLPTEHCGGIEVDTVRGRVCDYLGFFCFPAKHRQPQRVLVWPKPMAMELPELERYLAGAWRPKPGGGFAENHELRLYRPGDSMNQVHWKLTAKTGTLTIREPMEPQRGLVLVTLTLRGTPEELDRKLGRLLWVGQELTGRGISFEIRAMTGEGIRSLSVGNAQELENGIGALLCSPVTSQGSLKDQEFPASWRLHIGGEPDEE